ncbi:hypothetical protein [Cystobacter fuscus]|uniref:hypothetical protein n=1 Tax=Cystobacter fuscus TaxID=43 RepID=UPI0002AE39C3|nr:hypothetical protein [Cystobacter fuscus]
MLTPLRHAQACFRRAQGVGVKVEGPSAAAFGLIIESMYQGTALPGPAAVAVGPPVARGGRRSSAA